MRKTNTKALTGSAIMTSIAVIIGLISIYIPLIGGFAVLIWPVPIILVVVRHGYKWALLTTFASGVIIAMMSDPIQAARTVLMFPIGIVIGLCLRAGSSPGKTMFYGSAAALVSYGALTALTFVLLGINPFYIDTNLLDATFGQILDYQQSIGADQEQIAQLRNLSSTITSLVKILIPASFIAIAIFMAYISYSVARLVLRRLGYATRGFLQFKLWTAPRYFLYILFIGMGLSIIAEKQSIDWLYFIGINLFCFGAVFAFVQGLALIYFLADKYNLSRLLRGIILLLIFCISFLSLAVTMVGAFDMALDYRRLRTPRPS